MIGISSILAFGWPAASWSIKDEDYETLEWNDSNTSKKPTLKQIESKRKECEISVLWAERKLAAQLWRFWRMDTMVTIMLLRWNVLHNK
jgi:hypothetical protein